MTDHAKRAAFAGALAALNAARDELMLLGDDHPINAELYAAMIAALPPKQRSKYEAKFAAAKRGVDRRGILVELKNKALGEEAYAKVWEPLAARATKLADDLHEARKSREAELLELADPVLLMPVVGEWRTVHEVWASTYGSQTDAAGYAKLRAIIFLADVGLYFTSPAPRMVAGEGGFVAWKIEAPVASAVDVECVRLLPGVGLRETVRRCWANGRQPRVFMPFLLAVWI